jgi:hypothetical protein
VSTSPDHRISSGLASIGPTLGRIAACTLGLVLALCLAGLAGLLAFDAVAAAIGLVAGGGLLGGHAAVRHALEHDGPCE